VYVKSYSTLWESGLWENFWVTLWGNMWCMTGKEHFLIFLQWKVTLKP
jgi:hypothetical protein